MKEKKSNWYVNPKKYHFLYKTTCTVTGKFYYGMHSTDKLDDGYIGSGTRLWHAIKTHGRENFVIEILEFVTDREALKKREAELITEELLYDPMCMNLTLGGNGDWYHCNSNSKLQQAKGLKGNAKMKELRQTDPEWTRKITASKSKSMKKQYADGRKVDDRFRLSFLGKEHSDETKKTIGAKNSIHQQGSTNSQYGTCWITKDDVSQKIKQELLDKFLAEGWRRGRKMPPKLSLRGETE